MLHSLTISSTIYAVNGNPCPVQFLSQPFVVGDRVEILTSGGGHVITGTVERVDPMRTILRSDAELPITMPNKVLVTPAMPLRTDLIHKTQRSRSTTRAHTVAGILAWLPDHDTTVLGQG